MRTIDKWLCEWRNCYLNNFIWIRDDNPILSTKKLYLFVYRYIYIFLDILSLYGNITTFFYFFTTGLQTHSTVDKKVFFNNKYRLALLSFHNITKNRENCKLNNHISVLNLRATKIDFSFFFVGHPDFPKMWRFCLMDAIKMVSVSMLQNVVCHKIENIIFFVDVLFFI